MFSRLRGRTTYANVTATIALVFAMTGGAYAASHIIIKSLSQISPKVRSELKGAKGADGAPGAAGPQGPAGPAGAGTKGENGTNGTNGKDGESVKEEALAKGPTCKEGGEKFTVGATEGHACNGLQGPPGNIEKTLPIGMSEEGVWAMKNVSTVPAYPETAWTTISFDVPLAAAPVMHVIKQGETDPAGCSGNFQKPEAESGNFCVFVAEENNTVKAAVGEIEGLSLETVHEGAEGAGKSGTLLKARSEAAGELDAYGTWVVTG